MISSILATSHRLGEVRQALIHDKVSQAIFKFCQNAPYFPVDQFYSCVALGHLKNGTTAAKMIEALK